MATAYQDKGLTSQTIDLRDGLIAGEFPRHEESVTIVTGAGALTRGTILGKITATGKYKAYNDANSDGTQTAAGILACDVDATSGDAPAFMYTTGTFNSAKCTGYDAAAAADLFPLNVYFKTVA